MISASKIQQLQYESDTWKRLLAFMVDESIHRKNRLVEILKKMSDKDVLVEAEKFQNRFLEQDNLIGLLRNEVAEFDRLLTREIFEDGKVIEAMDLKHKNIETCFNTAKAKLEDLSRSFNDYLLENS